MSDQENPLLVDERDGVAWLTMNRPERLNALNAGLTDALRSYFQGLEDRADIRVVVLQGAGRGYCAGLDLKDRTGAAPRDVQQGLAGQKAIRDIMIAMRECPQPVISIVQGAASGGGLGIALASDIRLCTPDARFNAAFIKIGVSGCDMGSSYFLPRMVGASLAAEMLLTGRFLHADRAYAMGFAAEVAEDARAAAEVIAAKVADLSPRAVEITKSMIHAGAGEDSAALIEALGSAAISASADRDEGVAAFRAKRRPEFPGT